MLKAPLRLMVDTCVWIEYFTGAGADPQASKGLVEQAAAGRADLLFAPSTAKDVFYLLPRILRRAVGTGTEGVSFQPAAWAAVDFMREMATPGPLGAVECNLAAMMRDMFDDYEDNLVFASAETSECDFIVTYDRRFLSRFPEVCIRPQRVLELLERL